MATWFWLNIPAMVLAFALVVGLPLRMVLRDAQAKPALAVVPDESSMRRELVSV